MAPSQQKSERYAETTYEDRLKQITNSKFKDLMPVTGTFPDKALLHDKSEEILEEPHLHHIALEHSEDHHGQAVNEYLREY